MTFQDTLDYGRTAGAQLDAYLAQQGAREVGETLTGQAWQMGETFYTILSEETNKGMGRRFELCSITREQITLWF